MTMIIITQILRSVACCTKVVPEWTIRLSRLTHSKLRPSNSLTVINVNVANGLVVGKELLKQQNKSNRYPMIVCRFL